MCAMSSVVCVKIIVYVIMLRFSAAAARVRAMMRGTKNTTIGEMWREVAEMKN